ncbi:MAG: dUTP diphosphatase [Deltaproteobacteria bacterium]|nr:dUTP diphosphatase [Deltaproteobacteria bacterium]MBI3387232.1 dUTP diphosphatase [Deltaproteobacteria bacterium]
MTATVTIAVKRVRPGPAELPLPAYASTSAAGMDLMADVTDPIQLLPHQRVLIPTGIAVALPPGFEAQVRPRSGLALRHGITLLNSPGTIDADYRGEIGVILVNLSTELYEIKRGDRIAQLIIAPVSQAQWQVVAELEATARGDGGFGHTGIDLKTKT